MNSRIEIQPKKILMIGMSSSFGGTERYIVNLFLGLKHELYKVDFLNYEEKTSIACEEQIKQQGGNIVYAVKRKRHILKHYYEVAKIFKKKYDVIYYNANDLTNVDFLIFAKLFNKEAIKIVHAHNSQEISKGIRHIVMCAHQKIIDKITDKRYACSKTAGDWMFAGADYRIINNMIDLRRFHFDPYKKESMLKKLKLEGKTVWGTVGRLTQQKNSLYLVEIMKYACKIDKNIVFIHIGDGDQKNEMMSKIKEYRLDNNYLLLGAHENVEDYYQIIEKFVFPSLYEGLAFSVVEAQAMGIQCILSDTPNVSRECDMKADLVTWISLERGAKEWANIIYNIPAIADNLRGEYDHYIIQAGFSLEEGIKRICELVKD